MTNFNAANFYAECKDLFGQYAAALGYAKNGIDEVADLKPRREIFVATLLGDKSLSEACNNDPKIYYYNVIRYCLTAGIEYGAQWQVKPEGFEEKGYDAETGKMLVCVNPQWFRPTDVDNLWGNPSKAKEVLKWNPQKTSYEELVRIMAEHDRKLAKLEAAKINALK